MRIRYDMVACFVGRPGADGSEHEFLQLRRAPGKYLGGAWSTVRGKMEENERAWESVLRELKEETGIVPEEFFQLDTVDIFYLHGDDTLWHCPGFCALVKRDVEIKLNPEHDAWRWVSRSRIDADFMWPGERNQLAELCREVLDDGPAKKYLRIEIPRRGL